MVLTKTLFGTVVAALALSTNAAPLQKRIAQVISDSTKQWVAACTAAGGADKCGTTSQTAFMTLLAAAGDCDQQNAADAMIDLAKSLKNDPKMIALAQIFAQQPRNSPDKLSVNYCQQEPKNAELKGLFQCQFQGVDPQTFTKNVKVGGKGTIPLGLNAPLNPSGSCKANPQGGIADGSQLVDVTQDPGVGNDNGAGSSKSSGTDNVGAAPDGGNDSGSSSDSASSDNGSGDNNGSASGQCNDGAAASGSATNDGASASGNDTAGADDASGSASGAADAAGSDSGSSSDGDANASETDSGAGADASATDSDESADASATDSDEGADASATDSGAGAAATSAANGAAGGDFKLKNGKDAQAQNAKFATLTDASTCNEGDQACVNNGFAQCVGGKFQTTKCAGGTQCFALPLVNSPGTSIACTTDADATSRIKATGATGGVTGA